MRYALLILPIIMTFLPSITHAEPLVERIQARYTALFSMRAEFTQILRHKESGGVEERSGILYFQKPAPGALLVRWDTTSPVPELLLVAPDAIWNSFPDEELAYKYPPSLAEDSASLIRVITGQSRLDQDFLIERGESEENLVRLALYPVEPTQALTEAVLWVDEADATIRRVLAYDFYMNENEIRFGAQERDIPLDAGLFSYIPPEGFTVEDRTEGGVIENQLLQ